MDKSIFVDASAANSAMKRLEIVSNNLANANTVGFKSDHAIFKAKEMTENGARVYASFDKVYSSFEDGPIIETGRDLDVAINGKGFIAIQNKAGEEAYTRAGDLQIKNGFLTTRSGELVMGIAGPISFPNHVTRVQINNNGNVFAQIPGNQDLISVNRIKLVDLPIENAVKGKDGHFHVSGDGVTALRSDSITLRPQALEGSNVNTVKALTDLIELSRQFEFHTNLMKNYSENATKLNQILNLS